jgi:hypothetical protein
MTGVHGADTAADKRDGDYHGEHADEKLTVFHKPSRSIFLFGQQSRPAWLREQSERPKER